MNICGTPQNRAGLVIEGPKQTLIFNKMPQAKHPVLQNISPPKHGMDHRSLVARQLGKVSLHIQNNKGCAELRLGHMGLDGWDWDGDAFSYDGRVKLFKKKKKGDLPQSVGFLCVYF